MIQGRENDIQIIDAISACMKS